MMDEPTPVRRMDSHVLVGYVHVHRSRRHGELTLAKKNSAAEQIARYTKQMEKHTRKQQLRKAKKHAKRNRAPSAPRRNDWFGMADEDFGASDSGRGFERIMPRDESDRRKAVENIMYETDEGDTGEVAPETLAGIRGQVIEVSSSLSRIDVGGRILLCELRGALTEEETGYTNVVAVGDQVIVKELEDDRGMVEQVLPRRNLLARPDTYYTHLQNVIAANIDQVLIVASWRNPHLWPELIDRYLITAERNEITPVLCVNKIDLAQSLDDIEEAVQPYRDLGVAIYFTSAEQGDGLDALRDLLTGKISVLAGLSGVGKSSLLTAVQPDFNLRVGEVNNDSHQGRHTTSQTNMLPFGDDGYVIDTPGIREFGLGGLHRHELITFYPDLAEWADQCRFSNCSHRQEPKCAVRDAVENGLVSESRYHSFVKIWESLPE